MLKTTKKRAAAAEPTPWLPADCCATYSQQRHENSLAAVQGYCRQRTVQQLQEELQQVQGGEQQQQSKV
jgi:predicted NAD/FAD-dependent oxidoreductase